jgi:hypothetical protein
MTACLSPAADVAATIFSQRSPIDERWTNWSSPTQDKTMTNLAILEDKQCEVLSGGSSRADRYVTRIRDSYNTNNSYNFNSNYNSLNGSGIYAIGSTLS